MPKCEIFDRSDFHDFYTLGHHLNCYAHVEHTHKFLVQCTHLLLTLMLCMFEGSFAQCTNKYLMRMLSARIGSWCVCSVDPLVFMRRLSARISPDVFAQVTHKFTIIFNNFWVPKKAKNVQKSWFTLTNGLKSYPKKILYGKTKKKICHLITVINYELFQWINCVPWTQNIVKIDNRVFLFSINQLHIGLFVTFLLHITPTPSYFLTHDVKKVIALKITVSGR